MRAPGTAPMPQLRRRPRREVTPEVQAAGWLAAASPASRTATCGRNVVPVAVLAQAWRGGPQHQISWVLTACDILSDDQRTGRAADVACATSGTADVVDAIVIVTAIRHQAPVVTSDPRRPDPHRRLDRRQDPDVPHLTTARDAHAHDFGQNQRTSAYA